MPYRYMVVEHEHHELSVKDGQMLGHLPIHHLLGSYHWARLNDGHVLVYGSHSLHNHQTLIKHEKTTVLPHSGHRKTIKEHCCGKGKHKHHEALCESLGLEEHHTIDDLIELAVERHGPIFSPKH